MLWRGWWNCSYCISFFQEIRLIEFHYLILSKCCWFEEYIYVHYQFIKLWLLDKIRLDISKYRTRWYITQQKIREYQGSDYRDRINNVFLLWWKKPVKTYPWTKISTGNSNTSIIFIDLWTHLKIKFVRTQKIRTEPTKIRPKEIQKLSLFYSDFNHPLNGCIIAFMWLIYGLKNIKKWSWIGDHSTLTCDL